MGALPKRRISTGRKGRRRLQDSLLKKQVKHHQVPSRQKSMVAKLKKALGKSA